MWDCPSKINVVFYCISSLWYLDPGGGTGGLQVQRWDGHCAGHLQHHCPSILCPRTGRDRDGIMLSYFDPENLSCDESRKKRSTFLEQAFYFRKFSSAQKYCTVVVEIFVKILILSRFMLRRRLEYILLYSAISTARGFFPGWLIFYLNTRKFSPCPLCAAHPGQWHRSLPRQEPWGMWSTWLELWQDTFKNV